MTKTSKNNGLAPKASGFPDFDPSAMVQSFMSQVSAVPAGNRTAGWLEMNQHWMTFLGDRFKQDAALLLQLSKCTNPEEVGVAHTEFYKKSVEDYQQEFAEMAELGQKAMGQLTDAQAK